MRKSDEEENQGKKEMLIRLVAAGGGSSSCAHKNPLHAAQGSRPAMLAVKMKHLSGQIENKQVNRVTDE